MDTKTCIDVSALDDYPSVHDFLSSFQISKNRIKKYITAKKFLLKKVSRKDVLTIPIDLLNHHMANPRYRGVEPKIINEEKSFLAISKPCKVHSLPLGYTEEDNLISYLRSQGKKYQPALKINKNSYEKGLLYRLDYETSGLVLFAKDEKLFVHFRESNQKKKFYLALVHGGTKDAFSYAHHISYVGKKNSIGTVKTSSFTNAHLEGKKIFYDQKENVSLVLISLMEGMRHQIRVQMASSGYPIVGDPLYSDHPTTFNRMFLHAYCYQFEFDQQKFSIVDENFDGLEVVFDRDRALEIAHEALLRF